MQKRRGYMSGDDHICDSDRITQAVAAKLLQGSPFQQEVASEVEAGASLGLSLAANFTFIPCACCGETNGPGAGMSYVSQGGPAGHDYYEVVVSGYIPSKVYICSPCAGSHVLPAVNAGR